MVCTGDTLIFGVQMELTDAIKYVDKYLKNHVTPESYKTTKDFFEANKDNKLQQIKHIQDIFEQFELLIGIVSAPCCLINNTMGDFSKVYFGVKLCSHYLVSKLYSQEFNKIEDYQEYLTSGIVQAKTKLEANKETWTEQIGFFIPKTKNKPKIYSIPNGCFCCA